MGLKKDCLLKQIFLSICFSAVIAYFQIGGIVVVLVNIISGKGSDSQSLLGAVVFDIVVPTILAVLAYMLSKHIIASLTSYVMLGLISPIAILFGVVVQDVPIEPRNWTVQHHVTILSFAAIVSLSISCIPILISRYVSNRVVRS